MDLSYDVLINGQPGTAAVVACDNDGSGEADSFSITLSSGYSAGGSLGGGDIQLEKWPPGWQ